MNGEAVNPFLPPAETLMADTDPRFVISEDDFVAANWLHVRPRPVFAVLAILILALMATAALFLVFEKGWDGLPFTLFIGWILVAVFLLPSKVRKVYRQCTWMTLEQTVRLEDERLIIHHEWATSRVPIDAIKLIKRRRNLALVYIGGPAFHIIKTDHPQVAAILDQLQAGR